MNLATITLVVWSVLIVALCVFHHYFVRLGDRRLAKLDAELQALYGQIVSELRAEAYYRDRER